MRVASKAFVISTTIALIYVIATTQPQTDSLSGSRDLQNGRLGWGEIFWALLWRGCFLTGFFLEGWRYTDMISRKHYTDIQMKGEDVLPNMRVNSVGPAVLAGMFWLDTEGVWTEAISFAPTQEGGGLSLGSWSADNNPAYRIRALGDGTWAGTGYPPWVVRLTDPVASFFLEEGTIENPEKLRITIDFVFPFTCTRFSSEGCLTNVLDWTMILQNTPMDVNDGREPHPIYSTSIVWRRESEGLSSFFYEAIQIADVDGIPLTPAMDDFIVDVNEQSTDGALWTGVLDPNGSWTTVCSRPWWCFWC